MSPSKQAAEFGLSPRSPEPRELKPKFFNTQASPPGPEEKKNGDPDVNSQRPAAAEQTPAFAPLSKASLPIAHALAQPASTEATWSAGIMLSRRGRPGKGRDRSGAAAAVIWTKDNDGLIGGSGIRRKRCK